MTIYSHARTTDRRPVTRVLYTFRFFLSSAEHFFFSLSLSRFHRGNQSARHGAVRNRLRFVRPSVSRLKRARRNQTAAVGPNEKYKREKKKKKRFFFFFCIFHYGNWILFFACDYRQRIRRRNPREIVFYAFFFFFFTIILVFEGATIIRHKKQKRDKNKRNYISKATYGRRYYCCGVRFRNSCVVVIIWEFAMKTRTGRSTTEQETMMGLE